MEKKGRIRASCFETISRKYGIVKETEKLFKRLCRIIKLNDEFSDFIRRRKLKKR